jgi:hypothetical protein
MLTKLLLMLAASTVPLKQMPVDECSKDKSFVAFRQQLRQVVKRRDFPALLRMTGSDVTYEMEDAPGNREGFRRKFRNGRDPKFWTELSTVMRLGCGMANDAAWMGSVPDGLFDRDDPAYYVLVVAPGAALRVQPRSNARIVARLAWDVVELLDDGTASFVHVKLRDGRTGYMRHEHVRDQFADPAASFEKRQGKWVLTRFAPDEP